MKPTIKLNNPDLFVNAFEYAAIGMALVSPDGKILKVNKSLCNILGYQENELITLGLQEITHPDYIENNMAFLVQTVQGARESYHMEKRYIHKNGHDVWALLSVSLVRDNQGQPLHFISQVQDISDRKLAEEKVIEGERRYQRLVEESPDAVIILKKGKCFFVNEAGVKLLGATCKKDIIGKNIFEFVDLGDHSRLRSRVNDKILGEAVGPIEERFVRFDGKEIDVEIKTIPTSYQGQPAVHAFVRDISERKKTQELIINSEKLTVAGQLAAGIAHEVRNPLTAIKGFLQLMENNLIENKMYFEVISSEINRIETILSELLLLAKPQKVRIEQKSLVVILNHVVTLLKSQTNLNSIEIIQNIEPNLPFIYCDENQLKQVFINFLKNAVEAMPKGGTIHIDAHNQNLNSLLVRIIDQGYGIPEHILKRVGEPFFTTKENGTGLGLMICNQIIENHKGKIHIYSGNNGTTIEVSLPLS